MNARTILLLLVAVVIAAVTAYGVRTKMNGANVSAVATATPAKRVLVASGHIPAGGFVQAGKDLAWAEWPETAVQPQYIVEGQKSLEEFNGGVARRAVQPGEPITATMLVKPGDGGFLSAVLTPGHRAITIAVNPISGNGGFIFPGDHVDLMVTHRINVGQDNGGRDSVVASETFIENVRVLAVDQMLDNPENKAVLAKTVTLEVTPKEAEKINVASDLGKISISLRSLAADVARNQAPPADGTNTDAQGGPYEPYDDPFFSEDDAGRSATSEGEVSHLLQSGGVRYDVSVIRGSETQKVQFNVDMTP